MGVHVRGCRGVQGRPPVLYPCGVTTEEAKLRSLARHSKLSHPVFFLRPKPDAHRMYAQDQVVIHTVRM
jgi:hypothetical protein